MDEQFIGKRVDEERFRIYPDRCGHNVIRVAVTAAWMLVSDGRVWVFQKPLISWDLHASRRKWLRADGKSTMTRLFDEQKRSFPEL